MNPPHPSPRRWAMPMLRRAGFVAGLLLGLVGGLALGTVGSALAQPQTSPDTIFRRLEVLAEVLAHIQGMYVDEVEPSDLVHGAARGAVGILDPHSTFFSPEEYKGLLEATEGEYAGIGVELSVVEGIPEVVVVFPDSPAGRAGLRGGDRILSIDGTSTEGLDFDLVSNRLRGLAGSRVVLEVLRPNRADPLPFTLVRGWIRVTPLTAEKLSDGQLHIRMSSFPRRVAIDLRELLDKHKPLSGLILDLRQNPGGLFDEAAEVCDLFLSGGPLVTAIGRGGRVIEQRNARLHDKLPTYPIAVLVDGGSASAAEIVAAALQDRGRARLFGSRTYGKASVQSILELSDGSGLKLTVARYSTPSGRRIEGQGVAPDEVITSPPDVDLSSDPNDDATLKAARAWLAGQKTRTDGRR